MITLYRLITHLIYLLAYPIGVWKARQGSAMWRDRLSLNESQKSVDLWIHAASVGEVRVVSYLVDFLIRCKPRIRILVSVITSTGYQAACDEFGSRVQVRYLPADAAVPMRRALTIYRPRMIAIAETEIWPNFILEASNQGIPVVLVNGRMSDKGRSRYRLIRGAMTKVLACHQHFFFKTRQDAERYAVFGVAADRTTVAGDMKFDAPVMERNPETIAATRRSAGVDSDAFLLVAGSTRPGEEERLLGAYKEIKASWPSARLLIAPRHVERAEEIKALVAQSGLASSIFDGSIVPIQGDEVILVDRMGILKDLYAAANLAFVGGTLVDIGGHNILEPVWAGTPVVYGSFLANVTEAAKHIEDNGYGRRMQSTDELPGIVAAMLRGELSFRVKSTDDYMHSPTAVVGAYILEHLRHA